jgi:hypothetical protein
MWGIVEAVAGDFQTVKKANHTQLREDCEPHRAKFEHWKVGGLSQRTPKSA